MARYQAVRGTFDVLPQEMPPWHALENVSRDLAQRFGYREIRTPLFEEADLFTRGMGVMSGLIEKELWTFKDKYGQKLIGKKLGQFHCDFDPPRVEGRINKREMGEEC